MEPFYLVFSLVSELHQTEIAIAAKKTPMPKTPLSLLGTQSELSTVNGPSAPANQYLINFTFEAQHATWFKVCFVLHRYWG
jgi:hypothetical protein